MRFLPFIERAIAATVWTLGAGAIAIVLGLMIGSYGASTRAEGVALGFRYGQLIAAGLCPVVLWWRVYRTMWLDGTGRHAQARESRVETNSDRPIERKRPVKTRGTPQMKPEQITEGTEKPKPHREPRVRREPTP
jgi:hypothetical protein